MGHLARLLLVGRATYYLGWVAFLCGGLAHANVGMRLFLAMNLSQRNLLEISVVCFVICMASELRARDTTAAEVPKIVTRKAA
jgi:hypothetical protein